MAGCQLTTTSAVYFTSHSLTDVELLIASHQLIAVRDDNGSKWWLNPMAVQVVREADGA